MFERSQNRIETVRLRVAQEFGPRGELDLGVDGIVLAMHIVRQHSRARFEANVVQLSDELAEEGLVDGSNPIISCLQTMTLVTAYNLEALQWDRALDGKL